jgi:hypothetical protein
LRQPRASQRYRPQPREFERRLVERMLELVREHRDRCNQRILCVVISWKWGF